jgi:hypothetical protein
MRIAEFGKARAFGKFREVGDELDGAERVVRAF